MVCLACLDRGLSVNSIEGLTKSHVGEMSTRRQLEDREWQRHGRLLRRDVILAAKPPQARDYAT
jgi:hypothetical protein